MTDRAEQVAAEQGLAIGVEGERINLVPVTAQLADEPAGRGFPEPDGPIVAAAGEELAIAADAQGPHPSSVRVDRPDRFRGRGLGLPDRHATIAPAAEQSSPRRARSPGRTPRTRARPRRGPSCRRPARRAGSSGPRARRRRTVPEDRTGSRRSAARPATAPPRAPAWDRSRRVSHRVAPFGRRSFIPEFHAESRRAAETQRIQVQASGFGILPDPFRNLES